MNKLTHEEQRKINEELNELNDSDQKIDFLNIEKIPIKAERWIAPHSRRIKN